ncbi:hypothetical protein EXS54_00320 [Patescibacteria group bacterium]|nr:hypothetical protein [Patescibacteria group bacterium]
MSRPLKERFGMATVVIVAIVGIAAGLIFLAAVLFPTESSQAGLGVGALVGSVREQIETVSTLTGLSIGADLLLFMAAYILVCMFLWMQSELRTYFGNRSHFE